MHYTLDRKNIVIPVVTDVVIPGDPAMKEKAQLAAQKDSAVVNLQRRIDEVETAIGQKEEVSHSRAHAIRAEDAY